MLRSAAVHERPLHGTSDDQLGRDPELQYSRVEFGYNALEVIVHLGSTTLMGLVVLLTCCGSNHSVAPQQTTTGLACASARQCYSEIDAGLLYGDPVCMTEFPQGYCTHHCATDANCCSVAGECSYPEVCGPFESTGENYCFLSCEEADLQKANTTDSTLYCQTYANPAFICRSTGGGSLNRRVCVPNG